MSDPLGAFWADTAPLKGPRLASCVSSRTTEIQGHCQVCCARRRGPRPTSRTTDSNFGVNGNELNSFYLITCARMLYRWRRWDIFICNIFFHRWFFGLGGQTLPKADSIKSLSCVLAIPGQKIISWPWHYYIKVEFQQFQKMVIWHVESFISLTLKKQSRFKVSMNEKSKIG